MTIKPGRWRRLPEYRKLPKARKQKRQAKRRGANFDTNVPVIGGQTIKGDFRGVSVQNWSPRNKYGELMLQDNPYEATRFTLTHWSASANQRGSTLFGYIVNRPDSFGESYYESLYQPLYNKAYAKLRGKLYKGGASLGVTLGSWGQSAEMITRRMRQTQAVLDLTIRKYTANRKYREAQKKLFETDRHVGRDTAANTVLEANFGWAPLMQDVYNSLSYLAGSEPTVRFLKSRAKRIDIFDSVVGTLGDQVTTRRTTRKLTVTMSVATTISNPNIWMLNKLGLINPAAVVWDRIPWSFVVNMFVNVNTLINSYTDFVGLTFNGVNVTKSALAMHETTQTPNNTNRDTAFARRVDLGRYKQRLVYATPPKPTAQFQVPELSWNTAIIASSLVIQRFSKLNKLLGFPTINHQPW